MRSTIARHSAACAAVNPAGGSGRGRTSRTFGVSKLAAERRPRCVTVRPPEREHLAKEICPPGQGSRSRYNSEATRMRQEEASATLARRAYQPCDIIETQPIPKRTATYKTNAGSNGTHGDLRLQPSHRLKDIKLEDAESVLIGAETKNLADGHRVEV